MCERQPDGATVIDGVARDAPDHLQGCDVISGLAKLRQRLDRVHLDAVDRGELGPQDVVN